MRDHAGGLAGRGLREDSQVFLEEREVAPGDLAASLEERKNESRYVLIHADKAAPIGLLQTVQNAALAAGCEVAMATRVEEP